MHTDPITTLPLAQRLQMMEALWDSLTSAASVEGGFAIANRQISTQH